MSRTCVVCHREVTKPNYLFLCPRCCKSYDKARDEDCTIAALLIWAADRAWYFAKRTL